VVTSVHCEVGTKILCLLNDIRASEVGKLERVLLIFLFLTNQLTVSERKGCVSGTY